MFLFSVWNILFFSHGFYLDYCVEEKNVLASSNDQNITFSLKCPHIPGMLKTYIVVHILRDSDLQRFQSHEVKNYGAIFHT